MKIKYYLSKNKEVQTEETVEEEEEEEEKEDVLTVLSTFLFCVGSALIFSGSLFEKESQPCKIVGLVGFIIFAVGALSVWLDIEKDRFRHFKKFFQLFPDRIYKILFSDFPYWQPVFIPSAVWLFLIKSEEYLILSVLALFYLFLAAFAIVWGYRETRETTKDVQLA